MKNFTLEHIDKKTGARAGILHTAHGPVRTPVFMPVGTQATVKALDARDMEALGAEIMLANTYHLHLRPGEDTVRELGGVHGFMDWDRAVLTDSGGFQVFSLAGKEGAKGGEHGDLVKVDEDGVAFKSHLDGSIHRFTPEEAVRIQQKLGADIIMAFDQCTRDDADPRDARAAMERTHRWASRCIAEFQEPDPPTPRLRGTRQQLFGIIQGGADKELRRESAKFITGLPFDGIAVGGESVGFNMERTRGILEWIGDLLPEHKARYTMGVGQSPEDLFDVVERGADMFDCVSPTRLARNGALFSREAGKDKKYRIEIGNARFTKDPAPIDKACACPTCARYSRAYLRHLFMAKELAYFRLATIHNLHYLLDLMRGMREAILNDRFLAFREERLGA